MSAERQVVSAQKDKKTKRQKDKMTKRRNHYTFLERGTWSVEMVFGLTRWSDIMIIMVWQDANDQRLGHGAMLTCFFVFDKTTSTFLLFFCRPTCMRINLTKWMRMRQSDKATWFKLISWYKCWVGENVENSNKKTQTKGDGEERCPRIIDGVENVSDFHLKENCFYDDGDSFWYWKYYLKIY